jgi:hypothetical protein
MFVGMFYVSVASHVLADLKFLVHANDLRL